MGHQSESHSLFTLDSLKGTNRIWENYQNIRKSSVIREMGLPFYYIQKPQNQSKGHNQVFGTGKQKLPKYLNNACNIEK